MIGSKLPCPLNISEWILSHKDGTKDYRVTLLAVGGTTSRTLLVFSWGGVGKTRRTQVEMSNYTTLSNDAVKRVREKEGRGYNLDGHVSSTVRTAVDLSGAAGHTVMNAIAATLPTSFAETTYLEWLFETAPVTGKLAGKLVRGAIIIDEAAEVPEEAWARVGEMGDDGIFRGPEALAAKARVDAKKAARRELQDFYANKPDYGLF